MESNDKKKHFVVLDLGTTSTRANVIDKNFTVVGSARFESPLIQSEDGAAEIDPEPYFKNIVQVLRDAVSSAGIEATEIISLSLSCQRSTFVTWEKETGECFHKLITWKDRRAVATVNKVNKSFLLKVDHPNGADKKFTDKTAFEFSVYQQLFQSFIRAYTSRTFLANQLSQVGKHLGESPFAVLH